MTGEEGEVLEKSHVMFQESILEQEWLNFMFEVERVEILIDDDRSMINEEIREEHVHRLVYSAGMDLVNTDQADMGRSGGHE
eukprot:9947082-Karenia_brevis.AAC.1